MPKVDVSDVYVITCSDLHYAVGPIQGEDISTRVARMLTETSKSGCVYIPVPLRFTGIVLDEKELAKMQEKAKKSEAEGNIGAEAIGAARGYL